MADSGPSVNLTLYMPAAKFPLKQNMNINFGEDLSASTIVAMRARQMVNHAEESPWQSACLAPACSSEIQLKAACISFKPKKNEALRFEVCPPWECAKTALVALVWIAFD